MSRATRVFYTVCRGSKRPTVLLVLDFNHTANPDTPVFAYLVGKGITFDSGGYSLKQSAYMNFMKADMVGTATITGALALAAARGLMQRVKLYLCCADKMVKRLQTGRHYLLLQRQNR